MRWWVAVAWIDEVIREAEKTVDEVEVYSVEGRSVSADLKQKKINLATISEDVGIGIRTIRQGRIGSSSTNNPVDWKACLKAAIASGELATPHQWGGLPDPRPLPGTPLAFDPSMHVEPSVARDFLARMLSAAEEHEADITGGSAGLSTATVTLANSRGIRYTDKRSGISLSLEAIHNQSTGYEFDHSSFVDEVDPETVGERASFFACESAGGNDIPTGNYDVVLSPLAYAELLGGVFIPALNGRSVHAGRSRLAESLGREIMGPGIDMYDDPLLLHASGSVRWDAEGTETRRIDFVKDGILKNFAYDLKTAYRYGKQSTGNAVRGSFGGLPSIGHHNFVVGGKRDAIGDEPVVYVHNVVGAHTANPMSGEFSVEISNSFRANGESFETPIRSAMLSGNVFEMHKEVVGMSKKTRTIGSMIVPSIKLRGQRIIGR